MESTGSSTSHPLAWAETGLFSSSGSDPACCCCMSTFNVRSALDSLTDGKMDSVIDVVYDCFAIRLENTANVCDICRDRISDVQLFKMDIVRCTDELRRLQGNPAPKAKIKRECDVFSEELDMPFSPLDEVSGWTDDDQNFIKPLARTKSRAKPSRSPKKSESKEIKKERHNHLIFTEEEDQNNIKLPKARLNLKLDHRLKQSPKRTRAILKINDMDKLNSLLGAPANGQRDGGARKKRAVLKIQDVEQLNKLLDMKRSKCGPKRLTRPVLKVNLNNQRTYLKIEDVEKLNSLLRRNKVHKRSDHANKQMKPDERPYTLNRETLQCEVCQLKCASLTLLERHMAHHFPDYICENCGKGFNCQRRLKLHLISHVNDKFPCKVCGKILKNANAMNAHVKVHRDSPFIFMCPKCPERFKSYYQRQKHLIGVHGKDDLRYKCKHCDSVFTLRSELRRHVRRSHLQEKNHMCSECGAGFFSAHGLKAHMTKHTGERSYRCPVCEKAYPRMYTLREHMRIHNNDKRFVCGVCGRAFTQKCTLKGHMKVHEKYGSAPADGGDCSATSDNANGDYDVAYTVMSMPNAPAATTIVSM